MTAWMIALTILAIVLFTTMLYLINIWPSSLSDLGGK